MGALRKPETGPEADNVVYVLPPGAVRAGSKSLPAPSPEQRVEEWRERWADFLEHPVVEAVQFQVKGMVLIAVLVLVTYVGFVGAYRLKTEAGVDFVPGFSLPKVGPLAP